MKKKLYIVLMLTLAIGLCACVKKPVVEGEEEQPGITHSPLYIEGLTVEDVIRYFNEVALNTEYSTGEGNAKLIQKWGEKITYRIFGEPTDEDVTILNTLFGKLNKVYGFPGIHEAEAGKVPMLSIYFQDKGDFNANFGEFIGYESADGATQYWYYNATNVIYTGKIGYRTDINQEIRNSVLLEEVVNLLGFGDTVVREDSIVYQYSSEAQELSKMDWLLLKLMYHPDMKPGMDQAACETVIRNLYY